MPVYRKQPTPNPNSLKITADGTSFIAEGMESFNSKQEAGDHPLGSRLFAIPGIANVFLLPQFLTVTKHPATTWDLILEKIEAALDAYFEERGV